MRSDVKLVFEDKKNIMLRFSPQTPQRLTCHRGEAGKKKKKGCQKKKKLENSQVGLCVFTSSLLIAVCFLFRFFSPKGFLFHLSRKERSGRHTYAKYTFVVRIH